MEQSKANPNSVAIKWVLIHVVTSIILTYIFQFANISATSPLRYLAYIPFIAFLLLAQKEFRDQLGGYLTFGEGFSIAWRFGVFAGVIMAVFLYLYYAVLSPDMYTKLLEAQRDAIIAKGVSSDQADQTMQFMNKFEMVILVLGAIIGTPIASMIIGLIGAAILKKERTVFNMPDVAENYTDPTV
jgi:hypothetical protein